MNLTRSVLWHNPHLPSMERCDLLTGEDNRQLRGVVLSLLRAAPVEIRYSVISDSSWGTRKCAVRIQGATLSQAIELEVGPRGSWVVQGAARPDLDGALDIDLGFSPSTNSLPIGRLALEAGGVARIPVAWLRYPDLDVVRAEQVYARLAADEYEFRTGEGDFVARLLMDETGIVTRYGDLWRELEGPEC